MIQLPSTGFLRLPQIIGDKKTVPPTPAIYPVSKSQLWKLVKEGKFPDPVKLGPRITAWRVEDIRQFIKKDSFGYQSTQGSICKAKIKN
ncbi:MAG: AlpA family phage regulatory protein [Legionella sp.]|jgi:predicted DNA-binding transcriptional regulator AlpA|nr:AlpA family phage regulatory protein [Legionella sp.]